MTEARPADRRELLRVKREEYSSIVRSRKRKLRELYALATDSNAALNTTVFDLDAPASTQAETNFLIETDILNGRPLNDALIPPWQTPNLDVLKRQLRPATPPLVQTEAAHAVKATADHKTHPTTHVERSEPPRKQTDEAPAPPPLPPLHHGPTSPNQLSNAPSTDPATLTSRRTGSLTPQAPPQPIADPTPAQKDGSLSLMEVQPTPSGHNITAPLLDTQAVSPRQSPGSNRYGHPVAAQDAEKRMDMHEDAATPTNKRPSPDPSRAADIPSSPDSIAQTATTPAVHEVSTNTSPENEADSYADKEEHTAHDHGPDKTQDSQHSVSTGDTRDDTVEAQLLHESAAAGETQDDQKVHGSEALSSSGTVAIENGPVPGKSNGAEAAAPSSEAPEAAAPLTTEQQTFAQQSKWLKNLDQLVHHARKTISTADLQASIFDSQSCKILKRVYHLQQQRTKWSLRQPKRCPEPIRTKSHWDVLLQEMKWMRTDFREERKWKRSTARNLAIACAVWVASSPEQKKALRVNAYIPPKPEEKKTPAKVVEAEDVGVIGNAMIDAAVRSEESDTTPADMELTLVDERDILVDFVDTISPSAIFTMQEDAVVFSLNPSSASDTLLAELPMYGTPLEVPQPDLIKPDHDPDASWRRPVVPVSKYIESPIVISSRGPPKKIGRYEVIDEESDSDDEFVYSTASGLMAAMTTTNMAAEYDVGLFDPSLKPVRERLHAGHQFRPPSEYPMPMQCFYEYRAPSQWTVADDDQLKRLVRELSYNWSLIASILATKSLFASGAERRTPWECFERWVSLEGYPSDASRSPYFKVYQSRIDLAQRAIKEANEKAMVTAAAAAAAAAAAQTKGAANLPPHAPVQRRRPTLAVRVERHRNQKYLAMIESMRKLAKKREVTLHKQQQQAHAAASRKANEPVQQKPPTKSPKEYSRLRWERDQKMAERMAELAQRQSDANRRNFLARSQGQSMAAPGGVGAVPPQVAAQMAANSMNMAARVNVAGQHGAVPGQPRPRMPMQVPVNPMVGLQAHMAAGTAPTPISPGSVRSVMSGINQQNFFANSQAGVAQFNSPNVPGHGLSGGYDYGIFAGGISPALSLRLSSCLQTHERWLSKNYSQIMLLQRATAMHAASGTGPQQPLAGTSPRQYAQLLRAQQAQQVQQAQQAGPHHTATGAQGVQGAQHPVQRQGSPLTAAQLQAAQNARQANGTAVAGGALSSPSK
ncbi:myb and hsa domain containing protein [Grosmannia clavigera kw1407]|uniref:Vacuolar import and degradation protein 21 n=1 Tax=Grosmannia clavigera (strain kw1407 / UAMH 11150) TaxID=655863 RepID=F0XH25_GROCL|nr:myb and hsa domain containing protein [Grosmannia clavigera kw1407]EFX03259.1 myb and hsa domain containing protein [Grosmannia clavigera kw1407]